MQHLCGAGKKGEFLLAFLDALYDLAGNVKQQKTLYWSIFAIRWGAEGGGASQV